MLDVRDVRVGLVIPCRGPAPLAEVRVFGDAVKHRWRGNAPGGAGLPV
jgi:hypothetical protein